MMRTGHRPRRSVAGLLLLAAALLLLSGCGKKGPPVAPRQRSLAAPTALTGRVDGERLTLTWRSGETTARFAAPAGFRVYRARTALAGDACPQCPLRFEVAADLPFDGRQQLQRYSEVLLRGWRSVYEVVAYGPDGTPGPPSDRFAIAHPE